MPKLGRPPLPEEKSLREPTGEDWAWAAEFYMLHGTAALGLQAELVVVVHCARDVQARKRLTEVWGGRVIAALGQGIGRWDWKARKPTSTRFLAGIRSMVIGTTRVQVDALLTACEEEERRFLESEQSALAQTQEGLRELREMQRAAVATPLIEFHVAREWDADSAWDSIGYTDTGQLVFGCLDENVEAFLAEMIRRGALLLQQVGNVVVLKRTDR